MGNQAEVRESHEQFSEAWSLYARYSSDGREMAPHKRCHTLVSPRRSPSSAWSLRSSRHRPARFQRWKRAASTTRKAGLPSRT